jgi:rSAM/selenodomain-associated transferase 2
MPAPLSVVIPTLNAASELPETAEALLEGVSSGLVRELVISDGGSGDDTGAVARELGALWLTGPPGRGGQLKRGVAAASGEWVLLLHADTHLAPGWAEAAHRHMTTQPRMAGWFRLRFRSAGLMPRLVAGGANLRSRALGLPYGDQGLLVDRDVLYEIGGVPDIPLMEDVALARALRGRLRPLDADALTSAARYERDGWARRMGFNLATLARYALGADPAALRARYESRTRKTGK